jgi:hypothetical protein
MILVCNMGNNLSLPFVTKKPTNDNGATHYPTIRYRGGIEINLLL